MFVKEDVSATWVIMLWYLVCNTVQETQFLVNEERLLCHWLKQPLRSLHVFLDIIKMCKKHTWTWSFHFVITKKEVINLLE